MSAPLLLLLLLALVLALVAYLAQNLISSLRKAFSGNYRRRRINERLNSWLSVPAQVVELGINTEYLYPNHIAEWLEQARSGDGPFSESEIHRRIAEFKKNQLRYGGVLFRYRYRVNGRNYTSRQISPVCAPEDDRELVYAHRVGDRILVRAHPKHHGVSYVRPASDWAIARAFLKDLKPAFRSMLLLAFVLVVGLLAAAQVSGMV